MKISQNFKNMARQILAGSKRVESESKYTTFKDQEPTMSGMWAAFPIGFRGKKLLDDSAYHQQIFDGFASKGPAQISQYIIEVIKKSIKEFGKNVWYDQIVPNPDCIHNLRYYAPSLATNTNERDGDTLPPSLKQKVDQIGAVIEWDDLHERITHILEDVVKLKNIQCQYTFKYNNFDNNTASWILIKQNINFYKSTLNDDGLVLGHSLPGPKSIIVGDMKLWLNGGWTTLQDALTLPAVSESLKKTQEPADIHSVIPNRDRVDSPTIEFSFAPFFSSPSSARVFIKSPSSVLHYVIIPYAELGMALDLEIEELNTNTVVRELESGEELLIPDQTLLLKLIDKNGGNPLSSVDLKKSEYYRYPYIKQLVDQNKVITRELVINTKPAAQPKQSESSVYDRKMTYHIKPFTSTVQRIFRDDTNFSFIISLRKQEMKEWIETIKQDPSSKLGPTDFFRILNLHIQNNPHPKAINDALTLGWVRFTPFERDYKSVSAKDVWIDEIQTDLFSPKLKLPDPILKSLGSMETLLRFITQSFIIAMRKNGKDKFFIPNLQFRKEFYHSNPPKTAYEDVPPKLRFHKVGDELLYDVSRVLWDLTSLSANPQFDEGNKYLVALKKVEQHMKNKIWVLSRSKQR